MNKQHDHDFRDRTDSPNLTVADKRILDAVREVKYGSVEITIHHGRVVQVERREKVRLPDESENKSDAR